MPFPNTSYRTVTPTPSIAIQLASPGPWLPFCVCLRLQHFPGLQFSRSSGFGGLRVKTGRREKPRAGERARPGPSCCTGFPPVFPSRSLGSASSLALAAPHPSTWTCSWGSGSPLRVRLPAPGLPGALQRPDPSLSPRETLPVPHRRSNSCCPEHRAHHGSGSFVTTAAPGRADRWETKMLLMWRERKLRDEGTTRGTPVLALGPVPPKRLPPWAEKLLGAPADVLKEGSETCAGQPQETSRRIKHMTGQHGVWREQGGQGPL